MTSEKPNTEVNESVVESTHTKLVSYATTLNEDQPKRKVNFRPLNNQTVEDADFTLPMKSVEEVNNRFVNTLYGYFIGKCLAFPIVENYVKNMWGEIWVSSCYDELSWLLLF